MDNIKKLLDKKVYLIIIAVRAGTFVKFEVIEYHIEEDKEVVDELALIKVMQDGKEAMKEHLKCKKGQYVYSTDKGKVEIKMIKYIGIRGEM